MARITSQYGDVYFLAMDSSDNRSSPDRSMSNGLFLGIAGRQPPMPAYQISVTESALQYVIVFANIST